MRRFVACYMMLGSMMMLTSCSTPAPKAEVLKPMPSGEVPTRAEEPPTSAEHALGLYDVKGTVESSAGSAWEPVTLQTRIPDGAQVRVGPGSEATLLDPGRTVWRLDYPGLYRVQYNPGGPARWRVFSVPSEAQ